MHDVWSEVAGPLRIQGRALADAEAVLLVDDGQTQAREADRLLDQGMRSGDEPELSALEMPEKLAPA
jgi:hypothetical protein